MSLKDWLAGKKTYLAAIAALLSAIAAGIDAYVNGQPINWELLVSAFIALALIFLRQGIKKQFDEIP